jgi:hypothetical protein
LSGASWFVKQSTAVARYSWKLDETSFRMFITCYQKDQMSRSRRTVTLYDTEHGILAEPKKVTDFPTTDLRRPA